MRNANIDTVHLVFKTHLDVGFTDYAHHVIRRYFDKYIPLAIDIADELRRRGEQERLIWTTGSWLIYEYLQQAGPVERARFESAIRIGDLAWHGLPVTWYSELLDPSLFQYGLSLSKELDSRFGKHTIAAKMTDVPGHTRGIVPLLAGAGIQFLHIGVNPASTPPDVPPVFIWRDLASNTEIIVMYQKGSYGDLAIVPDLKDALAFAHTGDNLGPSNVDEIIGNFEHLRQQFPKAVVIASTLNAFAERLLTIKERLPVITCEIGDTWIHGTGTDPKKVARFRELSRLRREWIGLGRDPALFNDFSRSLFLVAEHTWGMDEKTHLADYTHYEAQSFHIARQQPKWKAFEASWDEQRNYIDQAIKSLQDPDLVKEAEIRLETLDPTLPEKTGYTRSSNLTKIFETSFYDIGFNEYGELSTLRGKGIHLREWASPSNILAGLAYELFSQSEYDRFYHQYIVNKKMVKEWAIDDFTKPGIASVIKVHRSWRMNLKNLYHEADNNETRFLLELAAPRDAANVFGCPERFTVEYLFAVHEPIIEVVVQWFDKQASRLPEAIWFSFKPKTKRGGAWKLEKLGEWVSPRDVIRNGARHLHAVGRGVEYADHDGGFSLETWDAPLIAPGKPSLLNFNNILPAVKDGVHINLYNNIWGTNHPMWYEEDAKFRFILRLTN